MNVTRSRSMRSSATSGSQRAMNTVRNGTAPGRVIPLSRPEMCAHGAGISTQSSARIPCTSAMSAALYASVACVCSTPFGAPLEPDVKSTAASCSRSVHSSVTGAPSGSASRSSTTSFGCDGAARSLHLVRARAGGATAPRPRRAANTRGTTPRPRRGWPTATRPRHPARRLARAARPRRARPDRRARRMHAW